ncbi:general substrate transporter [Ramaria rubella]|nr:general substrate transporter [Ramaria rubella]
MWIMPVRGKYLVWAITACCCQGFLLLGYDQGVMSGIIGADNQFGKDFNHPDPAAQGTIVAIYDIGCVVGSLITFFFGEHFGRKRMICSGAIIMLIGTAILTSSTTRAQLYVRRIVTGIGNGFNSSSIPVYQSETCEGRMRGALVCLNSTVTIFGLVIAYWLDYGLSFVSGPIQWRLPIGFQATFALLLLIQASVLPDSPRWLLAHGRSDEATEVLARLSGSRVSVDAVEVLKQRREIETSIELESRGGPFKYAELFQRGKIGNFRRICLCIGINVMQVASLILHLFSYLAPVVYQNTMGLSRNLSLLLGGFTALTYLAASFIPLWTVDRYGRRVLLMTSATGLSLCFILASILLSIGTRPTAFGATAMVFIFQIFLGIGYLPIPWLYPAEISTTRIRARGSSISSAFNWLCVFIVVQITPPAIANISWRVFIIFAIFNALWVPLVYVFFPETKGLELEDIDHIFDNGGFTGGVWTSKGGRTVDRGIHEREMGGDDMVKVVDEHNEKL